VHTDPNTHPKPHAQSPTPNAQRPAPNTQSIRCHGVREDGTPCRRLTGGRKAYCYYHDPATAEERETGVRQAPPPTPAASRLLSSEPFPLTNAAEVQLLLAAVANQLATAEAPDVPRAHALTSVAGVLLKSISACGEAGGWREAETRNR
jgi:hypothetical protein